MKLYVAIGSAAAALLAFGAVNAQSPANKAPVAFTSVDANSDGHISKDEVRFMDDLSGSFAKLDINSDNQLSSSEYGKWDRAAKVADPMPSSPQTRSPDPATAPAGSAGAQHQPDPNK
jgi:hypothetical protein